MNEEVILVNEKDEATGHMEKLLAHQQGLLHRAFSIFIFNDQRELLLQQRAFGKYHSGGLWTNTCCSHPAPGENTMQAASRRLQEEMGFNTPLQSLFTFTYKAILDRGLTEHEVDHVFTGVYNGPVLVNAEEAAAYQWIGEEALSAAVSAHPEAYTVWFRQVYQRVWRLIDAPRSYHCKKLSK